MTRKELDKIKKRIRVLSKRVKSKGPWEYIYCKDGAGTGIYIVDPENWDFLSIHNQMIALECSCYDSCVCENYQGFDQPTAKYIASVSPKVVLALLDEIDRLNKN